MLTLELQIVDCRLQIVKSFLCVNLQSEISNLQYPLFFFFLTPETRHLKTRQLGSLQQFGSLQALSLDFVFNGCMGWFCQFGVLFH
jgi:hypothetical protein